MPPRLRHAPWLVIAVILTVMLGFASGDSSPAEGDPEASPPAAEPCQPHVGDQMLGDALLHVPQRARLPMALVIAFHGARGNGPGFAQYTGFSHTADRHGFAVLYPTAGSAGHFWSLNHAMAPDDVGRIQALLPQAEQAACADSQRIFATGVSNGGGFAARVGCELAGTIAAVAPVAGGYRALDHCPPGRRASLLEIHGTADPVVPYNGRGPAREGDAQDFVLDWAESDGCSADSDETNPRRLVHWLRHQACPAGLAVEHIRLDGTDHGWPGAAPPFPRRNPSGFRANEAVWRFFAAHRLVR